MPPLIPPPVQGLIAGLAIWMIGIWLPSAVFAFPGQTVLAAGLAATGVIIDLTCVVAFFRAKTTVNPLSPEKTNALVINGLYTISRNPMYLGMLLILIGWALRVGSPLGVLPILIFVATITHFQIKPEEQALEKKFGPLYHQYTNRVRRWV